jgi:hypothetical protein
MALANLPRHPESVPINMLVKVKGTPLENQENLDPFEFIRTIAVARIMMPASHVRLSAGREKMNEQMQAMCFMAGANSIFYGCKLLTTPNPDENSDMQLFKRLGIRPRQRAQKPDQVQEEELLAEVNRQSEPSELFYDATRSRADASVHDDARCYRPLCAGEALAEREQAALLRRRTPVMWRAAGGSGSGARLPQRLWQRLPGPCGSPAIKAAFTAGRNMARGRRLAPGDRLQPRHQQLEETLADWLGVEAVLLFNCGFSANQAVLKALLGKDHLLWQDKLNHASLQEMGSQLPAR